MTHESRDRERRWLALAADGSHSWLGRASDPSEDEIQAVEQSLQRAGIGGFIAISEGDYWGAGKMSILRVRDLAGADEEAFGRAVQAFHDRRREALNSTL